MKPEWSISKEWLASMGLSGTSLGQSATLSFTETNDEWRSIAQVEGEIDEQAARKWCDARAWHKEPQAALEGLGLLVRQSKDGGQVVRISDREQKPLHIQSSTTLPLPGGYTLRWWQAPDAPDEVFLWKEQGDPPNCLVLSRENGLGCFLQALEETIAARLFFPSLLVPVELAPPSDELLRSCIDELADDPWLQEELSLYLQDGDLWELAVGVGLYARLRRIQPGRAAALVQALLSGKPDAKRDEPWQWALGLSPEQSKHLVTLAHDQLMTLEEERASFEEAIEGNEAPEEWLPAMKHWLYKRDDLACVMALLHKRGEAAALLPAVEACDAESRALLFSLPVQHSWEDDERFRRILAHSPDAWWAQGGVAGSLFLEGEEVSRADLRAWVREKPQATPEPVSEPEPTDAPGLVLPPWPISLLPGTPPATAGQPVIAAQAGSSLHEKTELLQFHFTSERWQARLSLELPAHEESEVRLLLTDSADLPYDAKGRFLWDELELEVEHGRSVGARALTLQRIWEHLTQGAALPSAMLRTEAGAVSGALLEMKLGDKVLYSTA